MLKSKTQSHWVLPYYWRNPLIPQDLEAKIHSLGVEEDDLWADSQGEGVAIIPNMAMATPIAMAEAVNTYPEVEDIKKEVRMEQELAKITRQP